METPTFEQAMQLALQYHGTGQFAQAEQICRWILSRNPDYAEALNLLGILAFQGRRLDMALKLVGQASALSPNSAQYLQNLGNLQTAAGQFQLAVNAYRRALQLKAGTADIYTNLGNALCELCEFDQAIEAHETAIRLNPEIPEPYRNLGIALMDMGKVDQSMVVLKQGLARQPDSADMHFILATALLLRGEFATGWREYEWRPKLETTPASSPHTSQPVWDGGDLTGKVILVQAEQGLGDALQFIRYVPMLAARGGRVVVQCHLELIPLFQQLQTVSKWIPFGGNVSAVDTWVRLLSLASIFGTTLGTIPSQTPLLKAPAGRAEQFCRRMGDRRTGRPRIGLVWAGRREHRNDHNRSVQLDELVPLLRRAQVDFFSVQKGPSASQIKELPPDVSLIDLTDELHDFGDTAALIENLDLVIGVDTAVVHLAGVMGKPVWVMLPVVPDWRWLLDREDSPWYPSARLFRQTGRDDWKGVVERIVQAVNGWVKTS